MIFQLFQAEELKMLNFQISKIDLYNNFISIIRIYAIIWIIKKLFFNSSS